MKPVKQETYSSCGIACVAMIVGKPFWETMFYAYHLGILKRPLRHGTTANDLIKLLSYFDVEADANQRSRNWDDVPKYAIVGIELRTPKRNWHWVVVNRGKIYDPEAGLPIYKISETTRKLRSFIPLI